MPSVGGPALYSLSLSSSGTQSIIQALQADGEQLWQSTMTNLLNNAVPDAFGGLIVTTCPSGNPPTVLDLSATGEIVWQAAAAEVNGGILATWTISPSKPPVPQYPFQIVDVSAGVVGTPYNLPFSPTTVTFGQSPTLVLGESGVAFATDGSDTVNGPVIASFNISSGSVNWSYQTTPQNTLSIIASTTGNGLVAKTTDQNANDTLIWFNPTGAATIDTWSASSVQYGDNEWLGLSTSTGAFGDKKRISPVGGRPLDAQGGAVIAVSDSPVPWADSVWLMPQEAGTSDAEPAFTLEGKSDCGTVSSRAIAYWLVNTQGRSLVTQPYVVFESQTNHSLVPPNGVSPKDYSGEQDKFSDTITPYTNSFTATSTQTFNFGIQGQRLYPVRRIDRSLANSAYAAVSPPQFSIVIPPGQQPTLNGQAAPYVGPCSGTYPPN